MAQYDVAHIDTEQYQQLRRLVLDGLAKAVIIVDYVSEPAAPGCDSGHDHDAQLRSIHGP